MPIVFDGNLGSAGASNSTTATITTGAAADVGKVVITRICMQTSTSVTSLVDTRSNTWTLIRDTGLGATNRRVIFYATVVTTQIQAGDSITLTFSGMTNAAMASDLFTAATITTDGQTETSGSGSGVTSGTISPTFAGDLVIGIACVGSGATITTEDSDTDGGDSWHLMTNGAFGSNTQNHAAYKITTSAVSQTYDVTLSGAANNMGFIVALKGASVAAIPQRRPQLIYLRKNK